MKKSFIVLFCLLYGLLLLSGCGAQTESNEESIASTPTFTSTLTPTPASIPIPSHDSVSTSVHEDSEEATAETSEPPKEPEPETSHAPGSEILTGTWEVGAVYSNNRIIDIHDIPAIEDMYDTTWVTFTEDGMFYYLDIYNHEGTYEVQERNDGEISFILRTTRTYRYQFEDGKLSEVNVEGSNPTFYVMFTDSDTFAFSEFDPITGKGKANDSPIYFVRSDTESDYITDNKTPIPSPTPTPNNDSPAPRESPSSVYSGSSTTGERNAVEQARNYLEVMAFSYDGLVDQLEFEGYTHSEAVYGVDHCGADWYEQAAIKAADYLDLMSFSRDQLIDQLEFDGFTHSQAVYGVEQNGY